MISSKEQLQSTLAGLLRWTALYAKNKPSELSPRLNLVCFPGAFDSRPDGEVLQTSARPLIGKKVSLPEDFYTPAGLVVFDASPLGFDDMCENFSDAAEFLVPLSSELALQVARDLIARRSESLAQVMLKSFDNKSEKQKMDVAQLLLKDCQRRSIYTVVELLDVRAYMHSADDFAQAETTSIPHSSI